MHARNAELLRGKYRWAAIRSDMTTDLGPQLFYLRRQFLALLSVLPLGRLLALDDLQQVQVLLLELLLLQQQFVEAEINSQGKGRS